MIKFFDYYDDLTDASKASVPFMIYPNVINDNRGSFSEVLNIENNDIKSIPFMSSNSWIKQINRSISVPGVIRGCHAQKGRFCQAKLVEALTEELVDMIIDARPESKSFGTIGFFILNPILQNKLFVPRGFLHSFIVPKSSNSDAIFNYYCDNVYDKTSDLSINPQSVLKNIDLDSLKNDIHILIDSDINTFDFNSYHYSDKDLNGLEYEKWMNQIKAEYESTGNSWWK